jgi:hypothetical protein
MPRPLLVFFFWEGLSLQAKQRSAPPQKPRACFSQAPTKRGVCASLPAALLPVDATHVATVPSTPPSPDPLACVLLVFWGGAFTTGQAAQRAPVGFFLKRGVYIQQGRKRTSEHHPRGKGGGGGAISNRGHRNRFRCTCRRSRRSYARNLGRAGRRGRGTQEDAV